MYTNGVQDGRRTCQQVTAPSGGGSPGTCSGRPIGYVDTRPDHFTGLSYSETGLTSTEANGGIVVTQVPNPAYATGNISPSSLSWSATQGTGVDMTANITANSHATGNIWSISVPSFLTASATSGTASQSITLTRNRDTNHSGSVNLTITAMDGSTQSVGSIAVSAATVAPTRTALSWLFVPTTIGAGTSRTVVL